MRFLSILMAVSITAVYAGDVFISPSSDIEIEAGDTYEIVLNDGLTGEVYLRPVSRNSTVIFELLSGLPNEYTLDTREIGNGKYFLVAEIDGETNVGPTITINEPESGVAFALPKMYVQPNPFDLSTHSGTLSFVNTPAGSVIKIYDMAGKVVSELAAGETEWDGRNDRGDLVASGTYMFYVTGSGLEFTGKFAVIK